MFTGIVERTARVAGLLDRPGRRVITLEVKEDRRFGPWEPAVVGESIAVDGVCLTVVSKGGIQGGETISFDAVPETLRLTTLGGLRSGDVVNLERSLRAGDRFGGHYVTGHVDGVATVRARDPQGDQVLFKIEAAPRLLREILPKGSVAINGISLTVIDVDRQVGWFSFAVIPHTLDWTNLREKRPRSPVNVETDAFGKWVLHAMGAASGAPSAGEDGGDERLRQLMESGGYGGGHGEVGDHDASHPATSGGST